MRTPTNEELVNLIRKEHYIGGESYGFEYTNTEAAQLIADRFAVDAKRLAKRIWRSDCFGSPDAEAQFERIIKEEFSKGASQLAAHEALVAKLREALESEELWRNTPDFDASEAIKQRTKPLREAALALTPATVADHIGRLEEVRTNLMGGLEAYEKQVDQLQQQLAATVADRKRLDWLQAHGKPSGIYFDRSEGMWIYDNTDEAEEAFLRSEIDAAMSAQRPAINGKEEAK